jgi:hypothetical protein
MRNDDNFLVLYPVALIHTDMVPSVATVVLLIKLLIYIVFYFIYT